MQLLGGRQDGAGGNDYNQAPRSQPSRAAEQAPGTAAAAAPVATAAGAEFDDDIPF